MFLFQMFSQTGSRAGNSLWRPIESVILVSLLTLGILLAAFGPARAQFGLPTLQENPASGEKAPSEKDAAPPTNGVASPEKGEDPVQTLLRVLEDPAARERLIQQLRAQQQKEAPPEEQEPGNIDEPEAQTKPVEPPSSVLRRVADRVREQGAKLLRFTVQATDTDQFWRWAKLQAKSKELQRFWLDFLVALAVSLGAALICYAGAHAVLRRVRPTFKGGEASTSYRRLWHKTVAALVDLVPLLVYAAIGAACWLMLSFPRQTDLVAEAVLWTIGGGLLAIWATRIVLRPDAAEIRLPRLSDEVATDLFRKIRRLVIWFVVGVAVFQNIDDLGTPQAVFDGVAKLWGLAINVLMLIPFIKYRRSITQSITGTSNIRRFLAAIWLPAIVVYALGTYIIWATEARDAFGLFARGGLITLVILMAVQPICKGLNRTLSRLRTDRLEWMSPVLHRRILRYLTPFGHLVEGVVYVVAAIMIALAWGLDPFHWIGSVFSGPLLSVPVSIGLVCVLCWVLWEIADTAFEMYLEGNVEESGRKVERSARARTLVPLFRTVIIVFLSLVFVGALLASFGLDIAPLLATAGIVGIAIGFGAQKLVQDVITGLFMLFQDTISVGNIVDLGGTAGTVQRLTIRTIELRDLEGNLHTIPFSDVSTVKNMSREFSYALIDVGVAYRENADHVMEVLRHLGAEMENHPAQGPNILAAIEVMGVDQLADSAVIIRCRFKVLPQTQWGVRRAFLAMVKRRFDELGIEIPFPQRTLHFAQPFEQPPFSTEAVASGTASGAGSKGDA